MHPQIADDLFQTILTQVAIAAVQLQGFVGDLEAGVGDIAFGHRAQLDLVGAVGVQRTGRPPQQHSRSLQPGSHVRQGKPDGGFIQQGGTERLPLANIGSRFVEGGQRARERAGRDVEPPARRRGPAPLSRPPPLRPFMAMPKPAPSPSAPPSIASAGTRTPSRITCAVGWACQPIFSSWAPKLSPSVPFSTTKAEMPRGPSPPVRAITT